MANKPLLIAMMGLPRSGKSTITGKLSRVYGAPIVNRDTLRLAIHGQRYAVEAEPIVKATSFYMIKALFLSGHPVVIYDETNYSKAARNALKDPLWDVVFYEIKTSPEVCKERAVLTNQSDLIPVIDGMVARYEPLGCDEERYKHEEVFNGRDTALNG